MSTVDRTKKLTNRTAGRSGRDGFSSQKDLTLIMVPYERFSDFPAAVDDLYRTVGVPFNLIVVEGRAPDAVRSALEDRQHDHRNITIVYTQYQPSLCEAFNLALPHIKTPYAFFMDNGCRLLPGAMADMLTAAQEEKMGVICAGNPGPEGKHGIGFRYAFLASQEALNRLAEFDEDMNALTAGIDLGLAAGAKGVSFCLDARPRVKFDRVEAPLFGSDVDLYGFRWNAGLTERAIKRLTQKWGVRLKEDDYRAVFAAKERRLLQSRGAFPVGEIAREITHRLLWARKTFEGLFGSVPMPGNIHN